jgi:signal transduction histidine kinase
MRQLFFKTFLWFWAGIVVVTATAVGSTALTHSRAAYDAQWRQEARSIVGRRALREAQVFDQEGPAALQQFRGNFEQTELLVRDAVDPDEKHEGFAQADAIEDYLLNPSGQDVIGSPIPSRVHDVIAQMKQATSTDPYLFTRERIAALNILGPSGRKYLFLMTSPIPPMFPRPLSGLLFADLDRAGIIRLFAVLAVAGLFCFWFARYMTNPIDKLRVAAREIANGNLQARVDQNVTNRRDELSDLGIDFNRMGERIEALITSQRRLLADVSHELRSPLTRLCLAVSMAQEVAGPQTLGHLDRIERETNRINKLIGQILALSRVESGVDLETKKPFELGTLVKEVAIDGEFEARGHDCHVKFDPQPECFVEGSSEMLRGAIENVVRNGIRHTARGTSVEISLEILQEHNGPLARICVRDHGKGIPAEQIAYLFHPFHRITSGDPFEEDQYGLGLAIAERAVRLHGGRVTASNVPEGGLLMTLEVPALAYHYQASPEMEANYKP